MHSPGGFFVLMSRPLHAANAKVTLYRALDRFGLVVQHLKNHAVSIVPLTHPRAEERA